MNKKKESSAIKDILIVTCITVVAGMLLGFVYNITKEPIARGQAEARIASQQEVFAEAERFEEVNGLEDGAFTGQFEAGLADNAITGVRLNSIDKAYGSGDSQIGYVVDVTDSDGYGGDIEIMVGISSDNGSYKINGISFLALSETAGMGMKAKESPFIDEFRNLGADKPIVYTKTGKSADNEIDAISGATITTSAVTDAANAAVIAAKTYEEVF
ncbi:MAG: FMN-binding protein [Lachnospiraceae bacterium]|nr:FMN-binding protein [Lachnospiraceae bacterium]